MLKKENKALSLQIRKINTTDALWEKVIDYVENCSWRAGKILAKAMCEEIFVDWEGIIVALNDSEICGYCTVSKKDCFPDIHYTPYIGYIFVDEEYRGNRISEKLIEYASKYLKSIGFAQVHIASNHIGLYEKYGFEVIDKVFTNHGEEKIYRKVL